MDKSYLISFIVNSQSNLLNNSCPCLYIRMKYLLDLYKLHYARRIFYSFRKSVMIPQEVALVSSLKRPNGPRHICLFNVQPPRIQESTSVRHLTQFQLQLIFMFLEVQCFNTFFSFLQGARDLCCHLLLNTKMYF